MIKEEIEHKLEQAQKDMMGIKDNILWLKEQLAEAEKLKPRHGNFGFGTTTDKWPILTLESFDGKMFSAGRLSCEIIGGETQNHPNPVFGNIFDLLKEWRENLERTSIDGFVLEICGDRIVIGGRRFLLGQAEEFWHKLGQLIMTLKRKQF